MVYLLPGDTKLLELSGYNEVLLAYQHAQQSRFITQTLPKSLLHESQQRSFTMYSTDFGWFNASLSQASASFNVQQDGDAVLYIYAR